MYRSFRNSRNFRPQRGSRFGRPVGGSRGMRPWKNAGPKVNPNSYIRHAEPIIAQEAEVIRHKFEDFDLDPRLFAAIKTRGYTQPTPIQDQTIEHILAGRDVVGIANTGTGKTAAFLLPGITKILRNGQERILIIVPTRELAVQIMDELKLFTSTTHIHSVLCIGGVHIGGQIGRLRNQPNIVIGTPGRLKDLIQQRALNLLNFKTIVLDEVDRMVDIGFIVDIRFIVSHLSQVRQSLFFSATISPEITSIMQTFLKNPITISVKKKETAAQVEQNIIRVRNKDEKLTRLIGLLRTAEYKKVLVFGRTKWNVEKLAKALHAQGFTSASIHGNKSQNQRLRALTDFKQDRIQVLVATDIAARGLDIDSVSHVINFDEPGSYTDYVHRIGRTGRADKQGVAITFVG